MKIYSLDTKLPFGKHKGQTLEQVLSHDFQYIDWCLRNIDNFVLDHSIVGKITASYGKLSAEAFMKQQEKWEKYLNDLEDEDYAEDYGYNYFTDDFDWRAATFDAITDGQLGDWEDFGSSLDDAFTAMGLD